MRYGISAELQPVAAAGQVVIRGTPGAWVVAAVAGGQAAVLSPHVGPRRARVFKSLDAAFSMAHRVAFEAKAPEWVVVLLGSPE